MNTDQIVKTLTSKQYTGIVDQLRPIFKDVPHLPAGVTNFLSMILPWLVGLGGIVSVISGIDLILNSFGFGINWWAQMIGFSPSYFLVSGILQLVAGAVALIAFNPLKNKLKTGWFLLFWGMVISLVQSVAGIILMPNQVGTDVVGMVIGLAIGLYLFFEIESEYKKSSSK